MRRLIFLSLVMLSTQAFAYSVGEPFGKGVYLYSEPVEIYNNNWSGVSLNEKAEAGEAEVFIRGQGKTANFYGVLTINCENGAKEWISAVDTSGAGSEIVPAAALASAVSIFCK